MADNRAFSFIIVIFIRIAGMFQSRWKSRSISKINVSAECCTKFSKEFTNTDIYPFVKRKQFFGGF